VPINAKPARTVTFGGPKAGNEGEFSDRFIQDLNKIIIFLDKPDF
jgi:hypothetical protein